MIDFLGRIAERAMTLYALAYNTSRCSTALKQGLHLRLRVNPAAVRASSSRIGRKLFARSAGNAVKAPPTQRMNLRRRRGSRAGTSGYQPNQSSKRLAYWCSGQAL
jgi:hypothetical protein